MFMVDTWFANKIKKMSNDEFGVQVSNTYMVDFFTSHSGTIIRALQRHNRGIGCWK